MFRRAIVAIASAAVVLGGATVGAAPAGAAISGASISPSTWDAGSTATAVVSWTESAASSNNAAFNDTTPSAGGNFISIEVGWGWVFANANPTATAVSYAATWDGTAKTFTCATIGVTFESPGFGSAGTGPECLVRRSSVGASNPGQQVVLGNTGGGNFTLSAGSAVSITFASGKVTAPSSGPATDTWRIISLTTAQTTTVRTNVPSPDGSIVAPPPVTLDFDGNGGTCTPSSVTGDQGTWGTALTADQCTNGAKRLAFFSTSPTVAAGATNVAPGGPIYFLEANRLYAIWASEKPSPVTDVVATAGLNSVKVTWKPPVSDGGTPIYDYCVRLRTQTNTLVSSLCSKPSEPLESTVKLPATNSKYTFTVVARNSVDSSEPVASAPVSPYAIKDVVASRKNVLLGLGGTKVEASGEAPGLAGQSLNVQYKVDSAQWTTEANAVKVDANSQFRWSKKFPLSANKKNVTVRFTYGSDAVAGPYVLARGGESGSLSAPRNIKVNNTVNNINVTWDPPKFDGGSKITGYTVCAIPSWGAKTCRTKTDTSETFSDLMAYRTYTITVAAKNAAGEGPEAKSAKTVEPTEASIRGVARTSDQLTADVRGDGFKKNSKFRVEIAIPVPGENARTWNWDEVTAFKDSLGFFRNTLQIPLDSGYSGERVMLRLVTPTGTVYSRSIRP